MAEAVLETDESTVIALVVEDNERVLKAKTKLLENEGFITFGVSSYQDAVREFRSVPRVDMVVTDINLSTDPRYLGSDTSGAALAQMLRAISSDLPIYGYSAIFAEGQLSDELSEAFTAYYPKGTLTISQQLEYAAAWKAKAVEHRDLRLTRARLELDRMRKIYPLAETDYSTLRELTPGVTSDENPDSIETILAQSGYRIKLIEPGRVRPRIDGAHSMTRGPIVLWIKESGSVTIAEVYAYPELYGHGETEEAAVADVLLLMDGYQGDLRDDGEQNLSPEVARLRAYLNSVLEV